MSDLASGEVVKIECTVDVYSTTQYRPTFEVQVPNVGMMTPMTSNSGNTMSASITEEVLCTYMGRQYQFDLRFPFFSKSAYITDQSWNHDENAASYGYRYTTAAENVLCEYQRESNLMKTCP